MIATMYWIALIISMIAILLNRNNQIWNIVIVFLIVMIMAGNSFNPDYDSYKHFYDNNWFPISMEPGYVFLATISRNVGLSYNQFMLIIVSVIFLLFYIAYKTYIEDYSIILICYMSFMIFLDTTQVRYFIFTFGYTIALLFLSKQKKMPFIILILAISLIHRSIIILLPFVFISPFKRYSKRLVRMGVTIIALLCVVTFLNGNRIPMIDLIVNIFLGVSSDKHIYFSTVTRLGFLTSFVCQFFNIFITKISSDYIKENDAVGHLAKYADVVYLAVLGSCFAMPLVMMNSNFSRYFRMNNMAIYILVSMVVVLYKSKKRNGDYTDIRIFSEEAMTLSTYLSLVVLNLITWIVLKQETGLVFDILHNNIFLN